MSDSYAHALADVRSCLATLADLSPYDPSIEYEQLLLDLDAMHGGLYPATYPVTGTVADLHRRTEARLDELAHMGADSLPVELVLTRLEAIGRSQARDPPHRSLTSVLTEPEGRLTARPLTGRTALVERQTGTHPDGHARTRRSR